MINCVVMAGGRPGPDDPLFAYTKGKPKALLKIGGRTMLEYVLDALQQAAGVGDIVVVGLDEEFSQKINLPVQWIPDHGGLVDNGLAAVAWAQKHWPEGGHILFCTSDIPAVNGSVIDAFLEACRPLDQAVYYSMVTQEVMEERFPDSLRTFVRLGRLKLAGGDLIVARPELSEERRDLLEALSHGRKHAWQIARLVGPSTLLKFLLHRISLPELEQTATRLLDQPVKVIVLPHAEMAMDVDKPQHLEILREYLVPDASRRQ